MNHKTGQMTESKRLKKKSKSQVYGAFELPGATQVFLEDTKASARNKPKVFGLYSEGAGAGSLGSYTESTGQHSGSDVSGKSGGYDFQGTKSLSNSLSSLESGSSDELFVRDSSMSGASGHYSIHCHSVLHDPEPDQKAVIKLIIASLLSLIFMVTEYIGGYYSSSLAVISDAGHLLSDFCGFVVCLIAYIITLKPASQNMNFGYYRAEILGSVISVLIVWMVTGLLVYAAIDRLIEGTYEVDADLMIIMASIGVIVNILIGTILHSCGCYGNFHGAVKRDVPKSKSISVRAALVHVICDVIMSMSVLVVAIVIKNYPEYKIADPILTFVFGLVVMLTTVPVLKDLARVLMEGTPRDISYKNLLNDLEGLPGVRTVHSLNIWSLSMEQNALSAHLGVDESFDSYIVLEEAKRVIRSNYRVVQSTIQVERYDKEMDSCEKCQPLDC